MGCWNVSCAVSHLPIQREDPIRLVLLRQGVWHHDVENDHPWAQWVPMSLPVQGWYDEYGGVKNVARTALTDYQVESIRRVALPLTEEQMLYAQPLDRFPHTIESITTAAVLGFLRLRFEEDRTCHVSPMLISESMWRHLCSSVDHEGAATRRPRVERTAKTAVRRLQESVMWFRERPLRAKEMEERLSEDKPTTQKWLQAMDSANDLIPTELAGGYDSLPDVLVRGDLHDDSVWRQGFGQFTEQDWCAFEDQVADLWTFTHTYQLDLWRSFHPNVRPTFQFDPTRDAMQSHRNLLRKIQEGCDELGRAMKDLPGKTRH